MEYIKKKSGIFSFIIALFACIGIINIITSQMTYVKIITNNIFIYPTLIGFYYINKKAINYLSTISFKYPLIFSILFTLSIVIGSSIEVHETAFKLKNIVNFILLFPMTFLLTNTFFANIDKISEKISPLKYSQKLENLFFKPTKKCFFNCCLFFLVCYFPVFLAYFPGIFTYDVFYQISFFFDPNHAENNPFLHNLLIYFALLINKITHSKILGVLCYTIFQTSIMFSIFSYCIHLLSKLNANHYLKLFALLFFALHPINHVHVLTATKDVLFSGFVLLFVLLLVEFFHNQEKYISNKKKVVFLILTIFIMAAFRHNGYCAYILFFPLLLFFNKKYLKRTLVLFLTPLILFSGYNHFKKNIGVTPPQIAAAMGIPLQQMGRVRMYIKNLEENDIQTYRNLVSKEKELEYFPYNVDFIKLDGPMMQCNHIENAMKNPAPYIKLWLKWGMQHPKTYVDAFLLNNYAYWFPNMNFYTMSLHYFFYTENRWDNIFGVEVQQINYIPFIKNIYDNIFLKCEFEKYPIISNMFSMSFILWINILCFFAILYKRKYKYSTPLIFNFCVIFTILLGPIALLRYIYFNYLLLPLFVALAFTNKKENNIK